MYPLLPNKLVAPGAWSPGPEGGRAPSQGGDSDGTRKVVFTGDLTFLNSETRESIPLPDQVDNSPPPPGRMYQELGDIWNDARDHSTPLYPRVTTAKDLMAAQEKKVQREMDKAVDKIRRHCNDEDRQNDEWK